MKVVLISGKAKTGKDTVGGYIKDKLQMIYPDLNIGLIHYDDELKYILRQYYGWNGVDDEYGYTLLQNTRAKIREYNKDYFVNRIIQQARAIAPDYLIIPDVKYKNEINTWFYQGYLPLLVRVERQLSNPLTKEQENHPSECELDKYNFDYYIQNDYSLQELQFQCEEVVKQCLI